MTGASSGIGADIARELADRGHGVTLVARREARLRELADELAGRGFNVEVIACDIADSDARAGLLDEVGRRGLTADILVNNAGIGTIGSVTKTLVEDEIAQVRVNVEAVIDLTTRAVQGMVHRGRGAILNVGSTAGYHWENTTQSCRQPLAWEGTPAGESASRCSSARVGTTPNRAVSSSASATWARPSTISE